MTMRRLTIVMNEAERNALLTMAQKNLRGAKEELRHLLRQEAAIRGLLPMSSEGLGLEADAGKTAKDKEEATASTAALVGGC